MKSTTPTLVRCETVQRYFDMAGTEHLTADQARAASLRGLVASVLADEGVQRGAPVDAVADALMAAFTILPRLEVQS